MVKGDIEYAEKRFSKGVNLDKQFPLNYLGLANVFVERYRMTGEDSFLAEAIIEIERALPKEDEFPLFLYFKKAKRNYQQREYGEAEKIIREIIDMMKLVYGIKK